MNENALGQKRSGRAARQAARKSTKSSAVRPGLEGGFYRPLSEADVKQVHGAVLEVLATIGMADASPELIRLATERGASLTDNGRLRFPAALVEDMLASAPREFSMYSRDGESDVRVGGKRVYFATSGEAISILDPETRRFRPSTLLDIYDLARLCDTLDNIHQFGQPCVATDLEDPLERDLSIAFALAAGTRKTSGMSIAKPKT